MTPEEKSLLERTYKMSEENNAILRKMRRSAKISSALRYVYWAIIVALSLGAYYFIQPYVTFLASEFGGGDHDATSSDSIVQSFQSLLNPSR